MRSHSPGQAYEQQCINHLLFVSHSNNMALWYHILPVQFNHCKRKSAMLPNSSSLVVQEVVKTTTKSTASNGKIGIITNLGFQGKEEQIHTCQGYHDYFRQPQWKSMRLPEISRVTLHLCRVIPSHRQCRQDVSTSPWLWGHSCTSKTAYPRSSPLDCPSSLSDLMFA